MHLDDRSMIVHGISDDLEIEVPLEVCEEIVEVLGKDYTDPALVKRELEARGYVRGKSILHHKPSG